jgi:hypothetical protein
LAMTMQRRFLSCAHSISSRACASLRKVLLQDV